MVIILALCVLSGNASAEIRALWALPWNIKSPAAIDQLVQDAVTANQTEILAEVRYRSDALYQTNRKGTQYTNPEPRSYILESDFDPLSYLLDTAHVHGLKVQAWVTVFNATPTQQDRLQANYLYQHHPDWITTDSSGKIMRAADQMGYFLDPGIPEVQAYLTEVILDVAAGYPDLDGIQLDYIRYPARIYGYHPISVSRYLECADSLKLDWNAWRIAQVTAFVRTLRTELMQINPNILLTAAVIANLDEAVYDYAQDWADWLRQDLVDLVYPMAYAKNYDNFTRIINQINQDADVQKVVVGLRAWLDHGHDYYPAERIIEKAQLCRDMDFAGVALFSYEGLLSSGLFAPLTTALFPQPVTDEASLDDLFIKRLYDKQIAGMPRFGIPASDSISTVVITNSATSQDALAEPVKSYILCNNIYTDNSNCYFSLYFPQAGYRKLSITDIKDRVVYQTSHQYPSGFTTEEWNSSLNDTSTAEPGVYTLIIEDSDNCLELQKRFVIE